MDGPQVRRKLALARSEIRRLGLVPFTDATALSVVSMVTGSPPGGSWWGLPEGHAIYSIGESLETDDDILFVRLWRGKVTLVHRKLWPALVRIASARSPWQVEELTDAPLRLLARIDREGCVLCDSSPPGVAPPGREISADLRELGRRLLVLTRSIHSSSGAHALEGESWTSWSRKARVAPFPGSIAAAQREIEEAALRLDPTIVVPRLLPWSRHRPNGRRVGSASARVRRPGST